MLTLFYSPHATSIDNESGRASGHVDVPLSDIGRQQARERGQQYLAEALDAVYCSDLQRASTTAKIAFAGRPLSIIRDARLRECDYGDMTQYAVAQIDKELPLHILEPFPNGQSIFVAVQNVGAFLQDVLREYDRKTIVVIGHRVTKYGLTYWSSNTSLEHIVNEPWEWRDIPIWRYEFHADNLEKRLIVRNN